MYLGLGNPRVHLLRHVRRLSSIVKSYPNYVERQCELRLNTTAADDTIEIDRETSVQVTKPSSFVSATINYVDTNPLGDKKQPIVLLVHGYPGSHESTRNLIEQFQRRNFRCIAPDMPYCGKTKLSIWSAVLWRNSIYLRARFLGELLKHVMGEKLIPIHTVIGLNENAYTLMSLIDQYEYLQCKSLIMIDPVPRKLVRFFPLAKFAFDFGRLPLHWPLAKFILKTLGHQELIAHPQRDVMAALRMWMMEETAQYDAFIHNLWLSRLRTMVIVSDDDKHLNRRLLDALKKDLAVSPFNKSSMSNAVIKTYACDHQELLVDRVQTVADDIEMFLSKTMPLGSPAAATARSFSSIAASREKEREQTNRSGNAAADDEQPMPDGFDPTAYRRAVANDFFSNAFGPRTSELKPNQPHSFRSAVESMAGGFIREAPAETPKATLESVKNEMRKKGIRVNTKS